MMDSTRTDTAAEEMGVRMPQPDLGPMIAANQAALETAAELQQHMMQRMASVNEELLDFVNRRLETDRRTASEMASSKSMSDAFTIYSGFLQQMMRDYADETGRIASLWAEQARETVTEMQTQMGRSTESLTRKAAAG